MDAEITETDDAASMTLPLALYGEYNRARTQWRKIAREAIRRGKWDFIKSEHPFLPVGDMPGPIIIGTSKPTPQGPCIHANLVWTELWDISGKSVEVFSPEGRERWYICLRDLALAGSQEFWFCLGLLAKGDHWLPRGSKFDDGDRRAVAGTILERLAMWWPQFVLLESRFSVSLFKLRWPLWCQTITQLGHELGVGDHEIDELNSCRVEDAGNLIRSWLKA